MYKIISIVFSFIFSLLLLHPAATEVSHAKTLEDKQIYTVQRGERTFDIARKFGVSEIELKSSNGQKKDKLREGEQLLIPESIPAKDKELLARLVHAEAQGEPYKGKVAVATVVLNRVESDQFPDSIRSVIYEERQFEPVENGSINEPAGEEAKQAVNEAIALEGQSSKALFFFNPDKTDSQWLRSRTVTEVIGNHQFAL